MEFEDQDDHSEEIELLPEMPNPNTVVIDAPSQQQQQQQRKPRYRECLKNHAVGLGGHAVDGCGEFLPAGPDGSLDALKCAACSCHRNFHRKDTDHSSSAATDATAAAAFNFSPHPHFLLPHGHHHHQQQFPPPYYRTPSGYLHVGPPRPLALPSTSGGGGGGGGGGSFSRDDEEDMSGLNNNNNNTGSGGGGSGGKRYRTRFTAEQKERMLELAEKLGWRIQKHDDEVIQAFCNDTGVKRHVLKVWMHNNKHTLGNEIGSISFRSISVHFTAQICPSGDQPLGLAERPSIHLPSEHSISSTFNPDREMDKWTGSSPVVQGMRSAPLVSISRLRFARAEITVHLPSEPSISSTFNPDR